MNKCLMLLSFLGLLNFYGLRADCCNLLFWGKNKKACEEVLNYCGDCSQAGNLEAICKKACAFCKLD